MKRRITVFLAVLAALAMFCSGCGSRKSAEITGKQEGYNTAPAYQAAEQELPAGFTYTASYAGETETPAQPAN